MAKEIDTREDAGQFYPGGKIVPFTPVTPGGNLGDVVGYAEAPTSMGGDGLWHKIYVVNGALGYDTEGVSTPPVSTEKASWVSEQIAAEKTRAQGAEALAVHLAGAETITGEKTFTTSPLVPKADDNDNSTKAATTSWVRARITNWWNAIKSAAVTFGSTVTSAGGFVGNLTGNLTGNVTGNVTGTASGNLPLSGGTITGVIRRSGTLNYALAGSNNTTQTRIFGGIDETAGASLTLSGPNQEAEPGWFKLVAKNDYLRMFLVGTPDGTLTWNGNRIVCENVTPNNRAISKIGFPSSEYGAVTQGFSEIANGESFTAPCNGYLTVACRLTEGSRLAINGVSYWSGNATGSSPVIGASIPLPAGQTVSLMLIGNVYETYHNRFNAVFGEVY